LDDNVVEREELFRATFEEAAIGIGHLDRDGRWLRVNSRLCRILGYSAMELLLRTLDSVTHPDEAPLGLDKALTTESGSTAREIRLVHKFGMPVWAHLTLTPVRPSTGSPEYFIAFVEDIGTRRAAEENLQQQLVINRSITSSTAEGLFMLDPNGRVTFLNPAAEELIGWKASEIIGKLLEAKVLPLGVGGDSGAWPLGRVFTTGTAVKHQEVFFTRKDGSQVPVVYSNAPIIDPSGMLMGSVLAAHDISERRRAEEALRVSQERYRSIVDNTVEGIWSFDLDGITTYANGRMSEILGTESENMIGTSIFEFVRPTDLRDARELFSRWMAGEKLKTEFNLYQRDGTMLHVMLTSNTHGDHGFAGEISVMVSDITELKRAQADLKRTAERNKRIADTLQLSLMMDPPRILLRNIEVESIYRPAWDEAEVGGDFCDAIPLGRNRVALVIGDVVGKGLQAAARTAEIKFTLRAFLRGNSSPEHAVEALNEFLCDTHGDDEEEAIIGLAIAIMHLTTGEIRVAVGGCEPPIIIRSTGEAHQMETGGLPLGAIPGTRYTHVTGRLGLGDTLLMTTDGVTEARRNKQLFGIESVLQIARENAGSPPAALIELILSSARQFAAGQLQDDACLLAARRSEA
jgi:PAS domain S-box-containing protein